MSRFKLNLSVILLAILPFCGMSQSALQSPSSFLGYTIGTKFTRHHQIVAYFNAVAQANPAMVKLINYGKTN